MKRIILIPALLLFAGLTSSWSQEARSLKKIIELKIPREGGANGAQVAWHSVQKKYYAAMAGNIRFCLGVFDETGKRLSSEADSTGFDIRGLWYNPSSKTLQMNGYDEFGWAEYKLDENGIPYGIRVLHKGLRQPAEQSTGAFDPVKKIVYFMSEDGNLEKYSLESGEYVEMFDLALGKTKESDKDKTFSRENQDVLGDYNSTTPVFTNNSGAEIGLLNHYKKQVELYDISSGYMTRRLLFPTDAPVNQILNFSYCNGIYWLFNKGTRTWLGYK